MKKNIKERFEEISQAQWILVGLIIFGIFLRCYHFEALLIFASDQVRDLALVRNVINNHGAWPLLGPDMTGGRGFRLGPIYYYFQIISAKIFGVGAVSQAYPDLFFSVLSIPLLYYFLRRYFGEVSALFSTSVYVFSYFAIEYSRFAWNVNLIPFFVLLFLFSFSEFLLAEEKARWNWIVGAGIALGVGVQLHAILLLLLPAATFFVFIFLLAANRKTWRKCAVIILIALFLNVPQLVSEKNTDFANTKTFFSAFLFKSDRTNGTLSKGLALDAACNVQANMHMVSSLGNKNICDFLYGNNVVSSTYNTNLVLERNPFSLLGKFLSLLFSLIGLGFLLRYFWGASGKTKHLYGLLLLYAALYFLIMIPIAPGSRMRYYLPIIFLPFFFLSFIFDFLMKKYPQKYGWIVGAICLGLFATNINSLRVRLEDPSCNKEMQANFGCNLPLGAVAGARRDNVIHLTTRM